MKPTVAADVNSEATWAADAERPEAWLARRLATGKPAESWTSVPGWYYEQVGLPVPAEPHQVSDQGRIRTAAGHVLSDRPTGRPKELPAEQQYRRANLCTGGQKAPVLVHQVVLVGFFPGDRAGRDTRHLGKGDENRAWNWFPEGVTYGTRQENAFDKAPEARSAAAAVARAAQTAAGTAKPPRPTFECRNQVRASCGGMVLNEGSRCATCAEQVGRDAGILLRLGMPSQAVGEFFGHTSGDWMLRLACQHGDWTASAAVSRMQRPTAWQRVLIIRAKWQMRGNPR